MTIDNFPAKEHIASLLENLVRLAADEANVQEHIIFLQGEHTLSRHDTDRELPFRKSLHTWTKRSLAEHTDFDSFAAC